VKKDLIQFCCFFLRKNLKVINSFIHQWLCSPLLDPGLFFSFVVFFTESVGFIGRVISPSQGLYLYTGQHKRRINAYTDIHALSGFRTQDINVIIRLISKVMEENILCPLSPCWFRPALFITEHRNGIHGPSTRVTIRPNSTTFLHCAFISYLLLEQERFSKIMEMLYYMNEFVVMILEDAVVAENRKQNEDVLTCGASYCSCKIVGSPVVF
jgi:hypothetical protein